MAGTDRSKSFKEVAAAAYNPVDYPLDTLEPGLEETTWFDPPDFTFPYGCHICEMEIDPETGKIEVKALAAVDDFGNQINPMIVEGQIHGGLAQGIGQAMLEHCVFDPEPASYCRDLSWTMPCRAPPTCPRCVSSRS